MSTPLLHSRRFLVGLVSAGLVIVLVAGGAFLSLRGRTAASPSPTPTADFGTPPPIAITPPASLEELATQYPELGDLLRDPSLASAYKEFLVAYQKGGIDAARDLARQRGLLNDKDQITITLVLDQSENSDAVAEELAKKGIIVLGRYQNLIDIAIPMQFIQQFKTAEDAGQMFQQLSQLKHVVKLRLPLRTQESRQALAPEGPGVTGAEAWHKAGITGKGVKVGILDMGFRGYHNLLGRSLPEQVVAESFMPGEDADGGDVHGTACAEIVHAMAPDAELFLAAYDGSLTSEAEAVHWLLSQGVQIISHSASALVGPMDGTGPDVDLLNEAVSQGVFWVNSSGNYATAHYMGQFTDSDGDGFHEFPNGQEYMGVAVPEGQSTLILDWNDWQARDQDYNLYLLNKNGDVVASSEDTQAGGPGDMPAEGIIINSNKEQVFYIAIKSNGATKPVTFSFYAPDCLVQFAVPQQSLGTPADAENSFTVGAVNWQTGQLEDFSSQGPTSDGRTKPDLAGPDATSTDSYAPEPFYGTSASTPHVAGAAALVLSAHPEFGPAEIRQFLIENAASGGQGLPDYAWGYGALHLPKPEVALAQTTVAEPTQAPATVAAGATLPKRPTATLGATAVAQVTSAPYRPGASQGNNAGTLVVVLGGMVCLGTLIVVGGVILLVVVTRRSRRAAAQPAHPGAVSIGPAQPIAGAQPPYAGAMPFAPAPPAQPPAPPDEEGPFLTPEQPAIGEERTVVAPGRLAAAGSDMASTTLRRPYLESVTGSRIELHLGLTSIGRAHDNVFVLAEDAGVSRYHAAVEWDGRDLTLTDLGSSNGTFVNGRRLEPRAPHPLHDGDQIAFGPQSRFTLRMG